MKRSQMKLREVVEAAPPLQARQYPKDGFLPSYASDPDRIVEAIVLDEESGEVSRRPLSWLRPCLGSWGKD
jgi:hypothetical protein